MIVDKQYSACGDANKIDLLARSGLSGNYNEASLSAVSVRHDMHDQRRKTQGKAD